MPGPQEPSPPRVEGTRPRGWVLATSLVVGLGPACTPDGTPPVGETTSTGTATEATGATQGASETAEPVGSFSDEEISIILSWLGPMPDAPPPDPTNAYDDDPAAAQLGQALFFETRYSIDGELSCATCHDPATGFSDSRSNTSFGYWFTARSSMTVLNSAYGAASEAATNWFLWNGRCDSSWCQALMGATLDLTEGDAAPRIALTIFDHHREAYEAIFGPMPALRDDAGDPVVPEGVAPGIPGWDDLDPSLRNDIVEVFVNFGKAIAAYERRLVSRDSRFDQLWADLAAGARDSDAMSDQEKEGLRVFIGEGRCLGCHGGPNFTDGQFHNIAVPQTGENIDASDPGRAEGLALVLQSEFNCAGPWSDHPNKDECAVSQLQSSEGELGAFKTPTLRGVASTPPYMHTGSLATLDDVVLHYDIGGAPAGTFDGQRDELMRPIGLSQSQRSALVAFLQALEGAPLEPALLQAP